MKLIFSLLIVILLLPVKSFSQEFTSRRRASPPVRSEEGEIFEAIVTASTIGSPVDPWLAIKDGAGKELTRADDAPNSPDPRLEWTAPTDGEFRLGIGNLLARSGTNQVYEVALRRLEPDFEVRLTTTSLSLTNGQTNNVPDNLLPRGCSKSGAHVVIGSRTGWGDFLQQTHDCGKSCQMVKCLDDFGAANTANAISPETLTVGRKNGQCALVQRHGAGVGDNATSAAGRIPRQCASVQRSVPW